MSLVEVVGTGIVGAVLGAIGAFAIAPQVFVTLERYNRDQDRLIQNMENIFTKLDRLLERKESH